MQAAAAATGNGTVFDCSGVEMLAMQVTGTFVGTVTFEATLNGSNWETFQVTQLSDGSGDTTATTTDIWRGDVRGIRGVRARVSAYTSGTITVLGMGYADT